MYSKDMLIGILLGLSKMDFILERSPPSKMGYIVRLSLSLRADESFFSVLREAYYNMKLPLPTKRRRVKHDQDLFLR